MDYIKVYVAAIVYVDERGLVLPLSIVYNGREYAVDKVVDVRTTPPEHVGGLITNRYDCMILGKLRHIYVENTGRWFVEVGQSANE
ncbi:MAG: hypothetical protein J1F36_03380 [Clostridiales bacterium]|nr:hypothetical protein [Clostridiales bacterium]